MHARFSPDLVIDRRRELGGRHAPHVPFLPVVPRVLRLFAQVLQARGGRSSRVGEVGLGGLRVGPRLQLARLGWELTVLAMKTKGAGGQIVT